MLTVMVWTSLAAPPSLEGIVDACWESVRVMSYLWFRSWNCWFWLAHCRKSCDVAGDLRSEVLELLDDRRDDLEDQEDEQREHDDVDDQDREPARQDPVPSYPEALDPVDGGVHRQREEQRGEHPPDLGSDVEDDDRQQERATAITTSEIAATLTTARAWIRAASTEALQGSGSAPALKSLHFDDPAAPQPGASPSPPPAGGLALGGARAATDKVI